jgi:hypothetical protein
MQLGAKGVINRKEFDCWGAMPAVNTRRNTTTWLKGVREFGKAIWAFTGKGNSVDMVFEHPGEATFPVSVMVVKRGGMVVICAGTTGYNLTMDARYLWMHQKRVQGSHFANLMQASQANRLVIARRIDPCMSESIRGSDIPKAHMKMWKNEHRPGNMAVLVSAPRTGLKTFDDREIALPPATPPPVAVIMGSQSDWQTMQHAAAALDELEIGHDARIVSAHRTPDRLYAFARGAQGTGLQGDHRRGRRGGTSAGHDGGADHPAGLRRAGRECRSGASTACCPSSRCRPACPSARWPSASRAPSTQRCSPPPCWRWRPRPCRTPGGLARRRPDRNPVAEVPQR